MRATTHPHELRTRVLDAADRLLVRHGYRKMTVDDIAAEAGIGKGSVYLAFASKQEAALACIDRMVDGLLAELRAIAAGPQPHLERLREMLVRRVLVRVDYARPHAASMDAMLAAVRPALLVRRERHFAAEVRVLAGLLGEARRAGAARRVDARAAAEALVTATNAMLPYSLSVAELGRPAEIERRARAVAELLVQGLAAPVGTRRSTSSHRTPSRRIPMTLRAMLFALGLVALGPLAAAAQGPPPPDQPDLTLTAAMRKAVVDTLAERIERLYVFPDKARETAKALRKRLAAREYDRITSAKEFRDSLTSHVQAVTHDLHLRVNYRNEPVPPMAAGGPPPESELRRMREQARRTNYGFERVERLPGNIGYLDLRQFAGLPEAQATAVAAMNFLGNVDALIVDLRRNGGGSPEMIATLLTYLTEPGDRLMFNTFYQREEDKTLQFWTNPFVPGPRLHGKPVYVLTSPRTFSAAEEFAYDIQTHKLGTIVGAVTGGGAHPGGMFRVHDHFMVFVSTGRAVNPVTKTNWEGVGVKPDIAVKPGEALRTAHVEALKKIIESVKDDPDRSAALQRALDEAEKRVADPEEDFVRPGLGARRRG